MRGMAWWLLAVVALVAQTAPLGHAADSASFRVGVADKDITPPLGIPMWGYGARHDAPSEGVLDPLMAKAIVIAAGDDKVAIVGTDLGRGPTEAMMKVIRQKIKSRGGHSARIHFRQPFAPRAGDRAGR